MRLAVPALGALAAEPLYVLVDTAIVGHLGTPQLAGLAIAGTILTTSFFLFNFLAYGTTASVARLVGAGDERTAARQAVQSVWLATGLGLALMVAGLTLARPAVGLFDPGPGVRNNALAYLRVSALGAPAVMLALAGVGYLRGVQNTRLTLAVALGSNVLNLTLEVVLVYGLGMGIAASAAATVVAQYSAAAAYVTVLVRHVVAADVDLRPDARRIRALAVVGRDLFVRTGALLAALAVAAGVASRLGAADLAAHQIAFQVWSLLALVLDAIAIAGQAMIGRMLGAGDTEGARQAGRRMVEWGVGSGLVLGAVVLAVRSVAVPLFTDDASVAALATSVLVVVALLQPVNAVVFVLDGVLIGAGDLRFLAKGMVVSGLVVFIPAVLAVSYFRWSLNVLWGAFVLLMTARLIGNAVRFAGPAWRIVGAERP